MNFSIPHVSYSLLIGGGMLCAGALGALTYWLMPTPPLSLIVATLAPLTETVYFSGTVLPEERTTLAFERSGRLSEVRYHRGDAVSRGAPLALLARDSADAELKREEALLQTELAQLDILVRGATAEEIALERARVAQYTQARDTARIGLENALINAFTVADNALYTVSDELYANPRTHIPSLLYIVADGALTARLEQKRLEMEGLFARWRTLVAPLVSEHVSKKTLRTMRLLANASSALSGQELTEQYDTTRSYTLETRSFLSDMAQYTNLLDPAATHVSLAQIASWRSAVGIARTNVQQALTTLDTAKEKYENAVSSLRVAESQFALVSAGAQKEDILLQESKVSAQRARILAAEAERARFALRAPSSGIVVERYKEPGELVSPGEAVYIIDSDTLFKIEGRVSELDIVRLKKGMNGVATFDALGNTAALPVVITHVDSTERALGNDNGYSITLKVVDDSQNLRTGMTAHISIELLFEHNVIAVPKTYIRRSEGRTFVQIYANNEVHETEVTTGEQTVDGNIAVLSGIAPGMELAPYVE